MIPEDEAGLPKAGEIGLTWITGWTGVWVSLGQWLAGDGGMWPWTRYAKRVRRGYPTHAFQVLEDGVLIEGQPGGARVGRLSQYADREVIYSKLPLTDAQRAEVTSVALTYEGTPYSFLDYAYLALWRFGIRPVWLQRKVRDSGHMICSQLADQIQDDIGMNLFTDDRLHQDVTPGDLYELLVEKGWMA